MNLSINTPLCGIMFHSIIIWPIYKVKFHCLRGSNNLNSVFSSFFSSLSFLMLMDINVYCKLSEFRDELNTVTELRSATLFCGDRTSVGSDF